MKKEKHENIVLIIMAVITILSILTLAACGTEYECVTPEGGSADCATLTTQGEDVCTARGSCDPTDNSKCIGQPSSWSCPSGSGCTWHYCVWQPVPSE